MIRLPINLHAMTNGSPDYIIDPLFFMFLDSAVTWAENLKIYLMLDNHSFDPAVNTDPGIGIILNKVWRQMAVHYKQRSTYILYEILNEPHGIEDNIWNQIQQDVINVIREVDQIHTIVAGPANWNSYNNLKNLSVYSDNNLIYTFHFYDPFVFTHQGASWASPSMVPLSGVPFPYDQARMPSCPPELVGTWIQSALDNYSMEGTVQHVKDLIDIAGDFMNQRNVPVFCGEFGVYMANSQNEDRVFWYETVRKYFEEKHIPWTIWDYQGGFGLFEKGSNEMFDYDMNIPMVLALGFNEPPQKQFVIQPDSTGFNLYTDYVSAGISASAGDVFDFYSGELPVQGQYCISWNGGGQYSLIDFDFIPDKDLSQLVGNGYVLDFCTRCNSPGTSFDIRFIDTKTTDPNDHPWRMGMTIDQTKTTWDGIWHLIRIPLKNLIELGSWDNNTWYNPEGKFDWSAVDRFEIVAEHQSMTGKQLWFDNIHVVDPVVTRIENHEMDKSELSIYPNPFNDQILFKYFLQVPSDIEITIFDTYGQIIKNLLIRNQKVGTHEFLWNTNDKNRKYPPGLYIYIFNSNGFRQSGKLLKAR